MKAKEFAGKITDYLNTFQDRKKIQELVDELAKEHPTLQQSFTKLCVAWLKKLTEFRYYDGRNKASVELAKKIFERLEEKDFYLPMI